MTDFPPLLNGRHFAAAEFACHDEARTPYPAEWADRWAGLVALCDAVRDLWGAPLDVVSGYRTPDYNMLLAANSASHQVASGSEHVQGRAADLRPAARALGDIAKLYVMVKDARAAGQLPGLGGLGIYERSGWIHVDTYHAADGHLRLWIGT